MGLAAFCPDRRGVVRDTGEVSALLLPGDVTAAALSVILNLLAAIDDEDPRGAAIAAPTQWTAARTVGYIADALLLYAAQVARRAEHRLPMLRDGRRAPASEQVENVISAAHMLEGLLRDLGSARALHPRGFTDASGWVGMAVTEILVHAHDTAAALGIELPLPVQVCARTVARGSSRGPQRPQQNQNSSC